jgi:hypothetical protein
MSAFLRALPGALVALVTAWVLWAAVVLLVEG